MACLCQQKWPKMEREGRVRSQAQAQAVAFSLSVSFSLSSRSPPTGLLQSRGQSRSLSSVLLPLSFFLSNYLFHTRVGFFVLSKILFFHIKIEKKVVCLHVFSCVCVLIIQKKSDEKIYYILSCFSKSFSNTNAKSC